MRRGLCLRVFQTLFNESIVDEPQQKSPGSFTRTQVLAGQDQLNFRGQTH